ncbi:MAG: type VI secretion system-associated protein TagF [Gammaproteobacteria bacterium]|nr:MAG: type VI secretion system-associated protein TagF [Gammaproteobacteria bacterium]
MKIGYFGKLPSYGDFIQRNVSPDLVNLWDDWLLQSIENSRQQLTDNWKEKYFNSPIWRFVIGKGVLNDSTITGLLMPSIDKSGRCYPFSIICQTDNQVNPFTLARKLEAMHENCEEFLLTLLEKQRPNLDEISMVLEEIYNEADETLYKSSTLSSSSIENEIVSISENCAIEFNLCNESFLEKIIELNDIKISIWSMNGVNGTNFQKRYFSGMPTVNSYHSFLIGAHD